MKIIKPIAAIAILMACTSASADSTEYSYCQMGVNTGNGLVAHFSTVFRIRSDIQSIGIENSFRDMVSARVGVANTSSPTCFRFDSYQETEDQRNQELASRRGRYQINEYVWSYRGD